MSQTINVRISGVLQAHVAQVIEDGEYENVSEFIRDLIRRDKLSRSNEAYLSRHSAAGSLSGKTG